jgi:hypothetical protein
MNGRKKDFKDSDIQLHCFDMEEIFKWSLDRDQASRRLGSAGEKATTDKLRGATPDWDCNRAEFVVRCGLMEQPLHVCLLHDRAIHLPIEAPFECNFRPKIMVTNTAKLCNDGKNNY